MATTDKGTKSITDEFVSQARRTIGWLNDDIAELRKRMARDEQSIADKAARVDALEAWVAENEVSS